ncbi:polymorphic toxin-type HINT domain-containing protein [Nonomuraea sp. NPDC050540]|uniref:polymorphic toxin-type HINT domain-containing protein n=1 Tax=Nonomuraea sp. NPDC050540 TaxID=3364367 RepID=UPI00378E42F9
MADGTTKPIEQVRVGDRVVATDPKTGKTSARPVSALIKSAGIKNVVQIATGIDGNRGSFTATDSHPFWVPALDTWIEAGKLRPGTLLHTSAGTYTQVSAIRRWTQQNQVVNNLTVNEFHTYYVVSGNEAVLVHNANPCGPAAQFKVSTTLACTRST